MGPYGKMTEVLEIGTITDITLRNRTEYSPSEDTLEYVKGHPDRRIYHFQPHDPDNLEFDEIVQANTLQGFVDLLYWAHFGQYKKANPGS